MFFCVTDVSGAFFSFLDGLGQKSSVLCLLFLTKMAHTLVLTGSGTKSLLSQYRYYFVANRTQLYNSKTNKSKAQWTNKFYIIKTGGVNHGVGELGKVQVNVK